MKQGENRIDFDLSALSLQQLIEVYENIVDFLQFLDESKIAEETENENE